MSDLVCPFYLNIKTNGLGGEKSVLSLSKDCHLLKSLAIVTDTHNSPLHIDNSEYNCSFSSFDKISGFH